MTSKFHIRGGVALSGEARVLGSKNEATKMMIASLLTKDRCTIENVPHSLDIDITKELCEKIGSSARFENPHRLSIETSVIKQSLVPELSRRNRIPILAIGPLLHRTGSAEVPVLGGCPIGHRPINFHIEALAKMGATIVRKEHSYYAEADRLRGVDVEFPYPSVGATENVLLAASLAYGKTTIRNAAVEPEIIGLIKMLILMGAEITVEELERKIEIHGVRELSGTEVRVMPDRNEIVSFATAALASGGDIFIPEIERVYLEKFLEKLSAAGGFFAEEKGGIRFFGKKPYRAVTVETGPHPAFMTDWQQPFAVLLTQAQGTSIIHETVYEDRFGYTKDLKRMGAAIKVSDECLGGDKCRFDGQTFNHSVEITGPTTLSGAEILMNDIRAGMAHLIAALAAEGESIISGVEHIDRGYERLDERLKVLGADIKRI